MRFAGWDRVAAFSCGKQLMPLHWDFEPPSIAMYGTICNYIPALGSWSHCMAEVIREHVDLAHQSAMLNSSVDWANFVCARAGGGAPHYTPETFWDIHANASAYRQPFPADPRVAIHYPVELNSTIRELNIHAAHAEFANLDNSNACALWIYYYAALVALGLFLCTFPKIRRWLLQSAFVNRVRARFQLPTMWATKLHAQSSPYALGGLFPSSLEASLLVGFGIVHTAAVVCDYSIDENAFMEPIYSQYLQGIGNRTGIVAFALLPLLVVFSTRCQLLQDLLGIKYTSVLVFHRWVGRLMMIDSVVHSFAFYAHAKVEGEYDMVKHAWFWITGVVATAIGGIMVVLGTGWFRGRWYELFLYSHILMAGLFFYLCYQHVQMFGWTNWVWISVGIWGAERLYRLVLIVKNAGGVSRAKIEVLSDEFLAITVPKPRNWSAFPGHYGFVYFLLPKCFWQSHPFTMCLVEGELRIVVSVKSGVTRHLHELAKKASTQTAYINVLLEGPYGQHPPLHTFDRVLLFAGGSGIPGPLAMAEQTSHSQLVVVARDAKILDAYHAQLSTLDVPTQVYLTRDSAGSALASHYHKGRPNITNVVADFVTDLSLANASGAIVCCGPPALNDQVRNAAAGMLVQLPDTVLEYIEEFQVW